MPIINNNGFPLDPFGFSLEAVFRKMVFRWNFSLTKWFFVGKKLVSRWIGSVFRWKIVRTKWFFVRKKLFFVGKKWFFVGNRK